MLIASYITFMARYLSIGQSCNEDANMTIHFIRSFTCHIVSRVQSERQCGGLVGCMHLASERPCTGIHPGSLHF